jgi:DNA-binding NtrC family response regulator
MSGSVQHSTKNGASAKPAIFVIDDEPMLLELAAVILEPFGFVVKTFRDPSSAVEAFVASNPRPALVITDYAMHNMTGLDLIKACRKAQPGQRVLMVSGTVGEDVFRDSAIKTDSFLAKPYHAKQLTDLVLTLVNR